MSERGGARDQLRVARGVIDLDHLLGGRYGDSPVPDEPFFARELEGYFPAAMRARFPDAITAHRLRRDIIATQLANGIVSRGGPTLVTRLSDQTGADAAAVAAAYAATRDAFDLSELYAAIDALDGSVPGALQLRLYGDLQDLLLNRMIWFIRHGALTHGSLGAVVGLYRQGIAEIERTLPDTLSAAAGEMWRKRTQDLVADGTPEDLAQRLAALQDLVAAPDIVLVAQRTGHPVVEVARTHFAVEDMFRLGVMEGAARGIPVADTYDRLALDRALDGVAAAHRHLTAEVLAHGRTTGPEAVAAWSMSRGGEVARIRTAVEAIFVSGLTLSKLTVAASLLGDLTQEQKVTPPLS